MEAGREKDSKIEQLNKELDDQRTSLAESCGRFSLYMMICTSWGNISRLIVLYPSLWCQAMLCIHRYHAKQCCVSIAIMPSNILYPSLLCQTMSCIHRCHAKQCLVSIDVMPNNVLYPSLSCQAMSCIHGYNVKQCLVSIAIMPNNVLYPSLNCQTMSSIHCYNAKHYQTS
jgi:hypothetical protein